MHSSSKKLYFFFKRGCDLLAAAILLLLLSPVFAAIALALKWENPRAPVFYSAARVGRNYRIFLFSSSAPCAPTPISNWRKCST